MSEPLKPFRPGDPFPRSAAIFNAYNDAANDFRSRQNRLSGGSVGEIVPPGVVLIRNDTSADLDRGNVVGLGDPAITPTDSLEAFRSPPLVMIGETPTSSHYGKFAVLMEPIRRSRVGWAWANGLHPVQVNFTADEPYADIQSGTTANLVGAEGGCPVIYQEAGTGTKWAVVRLGDAHWPTLFGTLDEDLNQGSTATMSITGTSRDVEVSDFFLETGYKLASGCAVVAAWRAGTWYVTNSGCCPTLQGT